MTDREWKSAPIEFRETALGRLPDAAGIDADTPWDELPYWLRRHIAHFINSSMRDRQPPLERAAIDNAIASSWQPKHACKWKDAIIDACVVDWVLTAEHENDPRKAVNDLLCWQQKLALDPAVSEDAAKLHALVREAFNAGYHCNWDRGKYRFDPAMRPGDPDGAYWAWWQQTRPGRLDPDTLEFK